MKTDKNEAKKAIKKLMVLSVKEGFGFTWMPFNAHKGTCWITNTHFLLKVFIKDLPKEITGEPGRYLGTVRAPSRMGDGPPNMYENMKKYLNPPAGDKEVYWMEMNGFRMVSVNSEPGKADPLEDAYITQKETKARYRREYVEALEAIFPVSRWYYADHKDPNSMICRGNPLEEKLGILMPMVLI